MKQLNRAWRLFGTAVSFSVFGLAGLLIGLLLFPLMFLFVRDPGQRQFAARKLISAAFGGFVRMMRNLGVLSFRIQGEEYIGSGDGRLVIANHPTLIDVVFLISLFSQTDCVIKGAVTKNPFMASTVRAANYIPNSEPQQLLDSCVARLQSGASLLLFPEGTRSVEGQPFDLKLGAAEIALRAGAEVLPVVIECAPLFLTKSEPWYAVPRGKPHFTIRIMAPVPLEQLVSGDLDQRHARHALNEAFLALISHDLSPDQGAGVLSKAAN